MDIIDENPPLAEVAGIAEKISLPTYMAALSLHKTIRPLLKDVELTRIVNDLALSLHLAEIHPLENSSEAILINQSRLLDALFSRMVDQANREWNEGENYCVDKDSLLGALRAQRNCRVTIEAMKKLGKPKRER